MSPRRSSRAERVRRQLSERDLAILHDLERVRLLSARQIERLHFVDGSPLTRARKSRRVLNRLHETNVLARLSRRVGGVHAGSAGFIYALSSLGQAVVESGGPAGGARRRRPWEPSVQFVDHILEVAETYVLIREHEQLHEHFRLEQFSAEPAAWRTFQAIGGEVMTLKPDAYVRIGSRDDQGQFVQTSFVEIDRATEHAGALKRKLGIYVQAFEAGVEQQKSAPFPNVVWIVPSCTRADQLGELIARLPHGSSELFVVTTNEPFNQVRIIEGGDA